MPRPHGPQPDQRQEEEVGLRARERLHVGADAPRVPAPLRLAPLPAPGVGAVEPGAVGRAVDLDAALRPAAGGADRRSLGRAHAPALALLAEGTGRAHGRAGPGALTPGGPCS